MMSAAQPTPVEAAQVRRFSLLTGLVVIVVVACTWGWRAHHDPSLFAFETDDPYYPWQAADPGTVTWSGDTMSGPAGSSVLHLDAADRPTEPLGMTGVSPGLDGQVYITDGTPRTDSLSDWPGYLGHLDSYSPTVLPDGENDLTLWFSANEAWTVDLTPLDAVPFDDHVSGQSFSYLSYIGSGGPRLLRMSCLAPQGDTSPSDDMRLVAYTSATGRESLATVRCPGETTFRLEQVPTVLEVLDFYDTEWTLTLQAASSDPEPSPGG